MCKEYLCIMLWIIYTLSVQGLDLTNGLIAHFDFNDIANFGADSSGNGNDATNSGASQTMDRHNECCAIHFDGNDRMTVNSPSNFAALYDSERSISMWFRSTQSGDGILVSVGSNHQWSPWNQQFAISPRAVGGIMLFGGGDPNDFTFSNAPNFMDNEWRHLVVTKQGNNAQLYIDSIYNDSTASHTYSTGSSGTQNIMIGCWNDLNRYFVGDIDEVRIYNRALTQSEIDALYVYDNKNCENTGEIKHINWNKLQNAVNNSDEIPYSNLTMNLDKNKLEMTFDIDLQYIGNSSDGNFNNEYNLGTTYIIDFQSFGTDNNKINEPGNCQNRIYNSFQVATFDEWWDYSETPFLSLDLGSDTYLAYPPPSQYWTLSIESYTCSPINYNGIFSWKELSECTDYNGNNLIDIVDDGTSITLSGTLYANVVSPYSMSSTDTGIYRSFPLIQQDFEISILKQINVLSSSGVKLFITSIIGIYENETDGSFKLSILTQSADYIELTNPNILSTPLGIATITSVTSTCLVASSYTCGQIFTITIDESQILCPPADFSGDYQMSFTATCPGNEAVCTAFFDDNEGTSVALEVTSNFIDNTCEPELYLVIFDGTMTFYDTDQFDTEHNALDNYVIGQDTIYVEIEVNFPDDGSGDNFNIFKVEIENVFVCTADDGVDLTINLNQQNGAGGCLSSDIDADGPYNIITNRIENIAYSANIISQASPQSNIVRFSFLTFNIGRTTMYIHVQLKLVLQNGQTRRLLLQSTNNDISHNNNNNVNVEVDQIRHFIHHASVEESVADDEEQTNNDDIDAAVSNLSSFSIFLYIVFCVFCVYGTMN